METADPDRLLKLLRQGEMDVALMHLDQPAGEGLDVYALYRERMFLFTTSEVGNGRRASNRITWDDVAALPLCLLRSAMPRSAELQFEKAAKVIHTDSPAVLAAHVASGRWSTVLPQSLVGTLTKTPALRAIAIAKPNEQVNVGFVTVKSDPLPAAVHALMEMAHAPDLVAAIRAMLAAHEELLAPTPRKLALATP
jgi:DNA-binding transcriptional LysR family regulator